MLIRRIITGSIVAASLIGLCWLDMRISGNGVPRGIILFPLFAFFLFCLGEEVLKLLHAGGLHPHRVAVHLGNTVLAASCWIGCLWQQYRMDYLGETVSKHGWQWASTACFMTLMGMACAVLICFAFEMSRFVRPGGVTINLAGAVFAITYVALLGCFIIQLRMAFGITALLSLIVVAKMGDTGAYTIGRIFGSHKMAPGLSPGKTIEGGIGGIVFACIGAWCWFKVIVPAAAEHELFVGFVPNATFAGCMIFGILISISGALGDLAASLIKRDIGVKDSGQWVPGFGGFLDLLDSLLMAAPVAYGCWALGFFGRDQ